MKDYCPNCGTRRGDSHPIRLRYHEFHNTMPYKPELIFSFRLPGPEYSKTVTETELKRMIDEVKLANYRHMPPHEIMILTLAAERMIEMAKAPKPKPKPLKLDSTTSIRRQLADLLKDIGLDPDRFLNEPPYEPGGAIYTKEPSNVCFKSDEPTNKQVAERAAMHLAQMLKDDLGVSVTPILLRLWLVERWGKVAKLAHKIHGSA
jgi:hypothetical protein